MYGDSIIGIAVVPTKPQQMISPTCTTSACKKPQLQTPSSWGREVGLTEGTSLNPKPCSCFFRTLENLVPKYSDRQKESKSAP